VRIKGGNTLFELCGITDDKLVKKALQTGRMKLPIKTKIFR
jgi:ribosomal protein L16/L10AE